MMRDVASTHRMSRRAFCVCGAAGLGATAMLALAGCSNEDEMSAEDDDADDADIDSDADAAAGTDADTTADEPINRTTFLLNTLVSVTVYGVDSDAVTACFKTCSDYEDLLSAHKEGSDIMRINEARGEPVEVAPETAELLERSLEYAEATDGAFDVTIGAVSLLWDFEEAIKPDDAAIEEAVKHVGWQNLHVDGTTVTLDDPEAKLDLGGIAKGWIAERLTDELIEAGATSAMVSLGSSSICLFNTKPDGSPWRIALRDPLDSYANILGVIEAADTCISSSGLYDQEFEEDGVLYWHILDPKTGYPVETDMLGDTIVCEDPVQGDALSTTLFVMGMQEAASWLEERYPDVAALLVDDHDNEVAVNDFDEVTNYQPSNTSAEDD